MRRAPRLLPLIAVAAGGVLALKALSGLEAAPGFLRQASAEAAVKSKPSPAPLTKKAKADETPAKAPSGELSTGEQAAPAAADASTPAASQASAPICAPGAAELAREAGLSPAELRVLQSLQARRAELDARARSLDTQMAVISAAEAKLDVKLKAMQGLKAELQGLLGQTQQKKDDEVARLVTVYQAMKPAEAAAVLSQLDDKVRLPVAAKMKERALAAILAKMPPAEARRLTESLASRFTPPAAAAAVPAAPPPIASAPVGDAGGLNLSESQESAKAPAPARRRPARKKPASGESAKAAPEPAKPASA